MHSDTEARRKKSVFSSSERQNNRWMMLVYDSLIYICCWVLVFGLQLSLRSPLTSQAKVFYFSLGYALFFGLRFAFHVYKQIWRHLSLPALTKEFLAGLLGSFLFVVLGRYVGKNVDGLMLPVTSLVSFAGVYMLSSILLRLVYCYLFLVAQKNTPVAQFFRKLITIFTWVDFDSQEPGALMHLVLEPVKRSSSPINDLQNIADQFVIHGKVTSITQINKGYINRTYRVETLSDAGHVHMYTLQRINTNVFPDVDALMDNFKRTTEHLHSRLNLPGKSKLGSVQTIRLTKKGQSYLKNDSGCWRMMTHFTGVYSLDIPDQPETFHQAGRAFGMFIKAMADVDAGSMKTVIPNFHNTKSRYRDLEKAIELDPKNRVKDVAPEIDFVRERADKYGIISDALESGKIPTRICHNDCNLNNILFDNETHLPVAIIDLDTVMPSSPLYDYGDSMRIGTNTATDDEKDLSKVSCDLALYEQYARGYLQECGSMLTTEELELLPYASLIITSEDGIRFLMDHINGDTYYNIYYPGQNLDRARTQLKLVEDMERKLPEIKKILSTIYRELGLKADVSKSL